MNLLKKISKYFILPFFVLLIIACRGTISGSLNYLSTKPICEHPPDTCAYINLVKVVDNSVSQSFPLVYRGEWPPDTIFYQFTKIPLGEYRIVFEQKSIMKNTKESKLLNLGGYKNPNDTSKLGIVSISWFNLNKENIDIIIK